MRVILIGVVKIVVILCVNCGFCINDGFGYNRSCWNCYFDVFIVILQLYCVVFIQLEVDERFK